MGRDAQGRPVLNMRSTEKFTEPVVTLLVDLHTPGGELVREYTLFLDPAGLETNTGARVHRPPVLNPPQALAPPPDRSHRRFGSAAPPRRPTPPRHSSRDAGRRYARRR